MDLYRELNLYMTTFDPLIGLGNESLKNIRLSRTATVESFTKDLIFLIKPRVKAETPKPVPEAPASPVTIPKTIAISKRSIKELMPPCSTINQLQTEKKYKQTLIKLSAKLEPPQKRPKSMTCPICSWEFPNYYSENDIQKHVNLCMDVKNNQDDLEKLEKKLKRKESDSEDDYEDLKKLQEDLEKKYSRGSKTEAEDTLPSLVQKQEDFGNGFCSSRLIYQDLGTIPKKTVDSSNSKYILKRSY